MPRRPLSFDPLEPRSPLADLTGGIVVVPPPSPLSIPPTPAELIPIDPAEDALPPLRLDPYEMPLQFLFPDGSPVPTPTLVIPPPPADPCEPPAFDPGRLVV